MPRPSLKIQRTEEILDAFERCVARYGVEGATLEKTAKEAGLQRSLLRHNVGNRDDLLNALMDRFLNRSKKDTESLKTAVLSNGNPNSLVNYLFDETYSDTQSVLVAEALTIAAPHYPNIAPRLKTWVEDFTNTIAKILKNTAPDAKPRDCREVAAGVVGIYFNVESLSPLSSMNVFRTNSKKAAMRLVNTLIDI